MSKRTRPRNLAALERRRRRHARRSRYGVVMAQAKRVLQAWISGVPTTDPEALKRAMRRRLLSSPSLAWELAPEMGLPILQDYPTPWRQAPPSDGWLKLEYRFVSYHQAEFRITPRPAAPYIDVSIGFTNPGDPLLRARAVGDAATCHTCATMDGLPIERADSVPWGSCTSENGCRCLAEKP